MKVGDKASFVIDRCADCSQHFSSSFLTERIFFYTVKRHWQLRQNSREIRSRILGCFLVRRYFFSPIWKIKFAGTMKYREWQRCHSRTQSKCMKHNAEIVCQFAINISKMISIEWQKAYLESVCCWLLFTISIFEWRCCTFVCVSIRRWY